MASSQNAGDAPVSDELKKLYLQVDGGMTSLQVLGLSSSPSWTLADCKVTYHALALRLHPDKCESSQTELHTQLFAKVQNAYEDVCNQGEHSHEDLRDCQRQYSDQDPDPRPSAAKSTVQRPNHEQAPIRYPHVETIPTKHDFFSKPHNHKGRRDERHAKKGLKNEERYQQAWQEERERKRERVKQGSSTHPKGATGNRGTFFKIR